MSDRERLEKIVRESLDGYAFVTPELAAGRAVDCLLAAGVTLPPAPPPVLEVTEKAVSAYNEAYDTPSGLSAAFPHLLRSCADGLTDEECWQIAYDAGMEDGARYIREVLRRVAARREA